MKLQTIMTTLAACALAGVLAAQSAPEPKKPAQEKVKVKVAAPLPPKAPMPPKAGQIKVAPKPPAMPHGMTAETKDGVIVIQGQKSDAPKKVEIKKIEKKGGQSTTVMSDDGTFTITLDGECCDDAKCEAKCEVKCDAAKDACGEACKAECEAKCEAKCEEECDDECDDCDDCEVECEISDAIGSGMGTFSIKLDDITGDLPAMIELAEGAGELKDLAIELDDITIAGPDGHDIKALVRDAVKNLGVHVNGEKLTRENLPHMLLSRVAEGGPCNIEISIKINGKEIKLPLDNCPLFAKLHGGAAHGGSCCESTSPNCSGGACAPAPAAKCEGCCPCEGQTKKPAIGVRAPEPKVRMNVVAPKQRHGPVRVIEVAPKKAQKKAAAPAPKKLELGNCEDGSCEPKKNELVIATPKTHAIAGSPMVFHREMKTAPAIAPPTRVFTSKVVEAPKTKTSFGMLAPSKPVEMKMKKPMAGAAAKDAPKADASLRARVAELAARVANLKAEIDRLQDLFDLQSK